MKKQWLKLNIFQTDYTIGEAEYYLNRVKKIQSLYER